MFRTADELNAREQRDSAGQEHGKAAHLHATVLAGERTGLIPPDEWPASRGIVNVIEQAALGHQQSVRLEWSFCGRIATQKKGDRDRKMS